MILFYFVGTINLSEVLQNCSVRQIALFDPIVEKDEIQNISREYLNLCNDIIIHIVSIKISVLLYGQTKFTMFTCLDME